MAKVNMRGAGLAAVLAASAVLAACGSDDDPEAAGDTTDMAEATCGATAIDFIVPYDPGGGTDTSARILGAELGASMVGEPEVEIENRAGGGGALGMNTVAAAEGADDDTLTIGITSAGIPLRWSTGAEGHDYPLDEMPLVGAFSSSTVFYVSTEAAERVGASSLEDLVQVEPPDELKMGQVEASGPAELQEHISEALGIPLTTVAGYSSSGDVILAAVSGEMDGGSLSHVGYLSQVQPYVEDGEMLPLFQTGILNTDGEVIRLDALPDIPTTGELFDEAGVPREGEHWEAILKQVQLYTFAQGVYAAPGTSDACIGDLRAGFQAAVESSEFQEAAEQAGADLSAYLLGEQAQSIFDEFAAAATG